MKILQYDVEKEDGHVVQLFNAAMHFLLAEELRGRGNTPTGRWPMPSVYDLARKSYVKYHTCFCVAVGLNDFSPRFLLQPTQPHVFEWVVRDVTRDVEEE